jgi:hypothetical protein
MKRKITQHTILIGLVFVLSTHLYSQSLITQTIRGTVVDLNTDIPLVGAAVVLVGSNPQIGTVTDANGDFRIEKIAIGRVGIQASYIGYNLVMLNNLILTSGKELVLKIQMEEKVIMTEEVVVTAFSRKDKPINEMAMISARSFTVDETNRYAGTMGDPSRMVANYAGVMAAGDQRNDIIIRGNSPMGLLWRVDGITVPNPNHFGALGTTGGPVSMLNNNLLTNSDFYTGAFPAEFGNALSGAFDIQMRSGNNQKREYIGQIGFNGFELGMEGPFSSQSKASYMANYRYSTLAIFDKIGLDLKIAGIPQYQDLTFKINIPDTKFGKFSLFGIGGLSYIELLDSKKENQDDWSYGSSGQDTYFGSDMGVLGLSHVYYLNPAKEDAASIKTTLSVLGTRSTTKVDTFNVEQKDQPSLKYGGISSEVIYSVASQIKKKFNSKNNISFGVSYDFYRVNYADSFYNGRVFLKNLDIKGNSDLAQGFFQWQHKFSDKVVLYSGLHSQLFTLNNSFAVEPRASMKWFVKPGQSLTLGYGLHSQVQPRSVYFVETSQEKFVGQDPNPHYTFHRTNEDLGFSKSHHIVLGYDYLISKNFRLKAETYYQRLFNIPVESHKSYFSMLNLGDNFYVEARDSLVNKGTGYNIGIEITLEKFFADNYYFLVTTSLYDARYKGSDNVERHTAFAGNYVVNLLAGYEIKIGKNNSLSFDFKNVLSGGKRYLYIDLDKSIKKRETVYDESRAYEDRYSHYLRLDGRISFKMNGKRFNQEWALDFQNITMKENMLMEQFDPTTNKIKQEYQMGFMPMMLWRIQF